MTLKAEKGKTKAEQQPDVRDAMTEVDKNYPSGVLTVDETPAQRVADYRAKVQEYRDMLDKTDAAFGKDVVGAKRLAAKAEAATMRKSLLADLDKKTADLKASLESVLTPDQRQKVMTSTPPLPALYVDRRDHGLGPDDHRRLSADRPPVAAQLRAGGRLPADDLFLDAALALAADAAQHRGQLHRIVNANLIEMFALLALATTASGRWFGVDALIHWIFAALFRRRKPQPAPVLRAA